MKWLQNSFGFVFALVSGILVLLSLVIVTPIYICIFYFGGKRADHVAHGLSRIWAAYVLICTGVRLRVHGRENINPGQTYVFVSNHRSHLDIPVCARTTRNVFKFLAKEELTKAPLLGYIIKNLYITVRRQSIRDRVMALKKMEEALQKGISVWLYPEGTRNKTDMPLQDFQDGAFTLAVNTGMPIAVLTIMDTRKRLQPGQLIKLLPGTVDAWWETPIETTGLERKDIPTLKEKVREMMEQRIRAAAGH